MNTIRFIKLTPSKINGRFEFLEIALAALIGARPKPRGIVIKGLTYEIKGSTLDFWKFAAQHAIRGRSNLAIRGGSWDCAATEPDDLGFFSAFGETYFLDAN